MNVQKAYLVKGLTEMNYPVGKDMIDVIKKVKIMAHTFLAVNTIDKNVTLWCRGSSGAIISALFASHIQINGYDVKIAHVKKEGEKSHSGKPLYDECDINIIIDDFIATGSTIRAIFNAIKQSPQNVEEIRIEYLIVGGWISNIYIDDHDKIKIINTISSDVSETSDLFEGTELIRIDKLQLK